ncbi:hypothetical protein H5410_038142 [Solanum commersonii]|uniref:Uncharacterized protein n=1 Tax=Solanum commersonii TaxID=4109 RepID=A0A9J5YD39_SOLCO|nr:hypothetical protein H5410_038142 [Solanum commersonii]
MEALLLMCSLQEEVSSIKESFATLEASSSLSLSRSLAASLLLVSMEQPLLQKHKEEEKQVVVKEVVKEDIVKGDQQDFQLKYPRLAASFESMAGMSTMYPNGTSFLKEKMSLIATDTAKVLEEK